MIQSLPPLENSSPASSLTDDSQARATRRGLIFYVAFTWGVVGVLALFARALWRLTPMAWQPIATRSLSNFHIALYVLWVLFNAYSEGYRAFQKAFCPRVVGRALHLAQNPKPLHVLLAPAFCLSLFHANRRGKIVAWTMVFVIAGLVALLRITPQPWRGIIDGGVVVALAWGFVVMVVLSLRALFGSLPPAKLNLPGS